MAYSLQSWVQPPRRIRSRDWYHVDVKSVRRWSEHCTENPKTVVIARTPEYRNQAAIRRWSELPLECAVASIDGSLTDRYRAHEAQCDPSEMVQEITGLQDVISAINE